VLLTWASPSKHVAICYMDTLEQHKPILPCYAAVSGLGQNGAMFVLSMCLSLRERGNGSRWSQQFAGAQGGIWFCSRVLCSHQCSQFFASAWCTWDAHYCLSLTSITGSANCCSQPEQLPVGAGVCAAMIAVIRVLECVDKDSRCYALFLTSFCPVATS
jgi:hypothetical protein